MLYRFREAQAAEQQQKQVLDAHSATRAGLGRGEKHDGAEGGGVTRPLPLDVEQHRRGERGQGGQEDGDEKVHR